MLLGFQQYLVDKGFKRTCTSITGKKIEDYESLFLSSYNPLYYDFTKDDLWCYWGLYERGKGSVMDLGRDKMFIISNEGDVRIYTDGYRILFKNWLADRYDEIYEVFIRNDKQFYIDCRDEKNIIISILSKNK